MAQSCLRHITVEVNCGFSRTAIRELTNRNKGCSNDSDAQNRALEFQNLFKDCPKYFHNGSYFDSCGYNGSQFDRDCKSVLLHFHKKWHPKESRLDYEKQFSIENWKALPTHKQKGHTMAKCEACRDEYYHYQQNYPQGPHFNPVPILSVDVQELHRLGKAKGTRKVLAEMNASFSNVFDASFTSSLVKHGKEPVHMKPTPNERKKN